MPSSFLILYGRSSFQPDTISVCLYLVRDFVVAHFDYDRPVLLDIQASGVSHVAISRMGDLCGISEFSIYLLNERPDLSENIIGRVPS